MKNAAAIIALACAVLLGYAGAFVCPVWKAADTLTGHSEGLLRIPGQLDELGENMEQVGEGIGKISRALDRFPFREGEGAPSKADIADPAGSLRELGHPGIIDHNPNAPGAAGSAGLIGSSGPSGGGGG